MAGLKGVFHRLPLEKKLGAKVDEFKRILNKSDGKVEYDWRDVEYIRTKNDYLDWKYKMGGDRNFDSSRPRRSGLKDCIDSFKRVAAVEEEMAVKTISKQVKSIFHSPNCPNTPLTVTQSRKICCRWSRGPGTLPRRGSTADYG